MNNVQNVVVILILVYHSHKPIEFKPGDSKCHTFLFHRILLAISKRNYCQYPNGFSTISRKLPTSSELRQMLAAQTFCDLMLE
jgi:mannitol/fructose-specific phosphotransferase system IIA component (Ntr-type)